MTAATLTVRPPMADASDVLHALGTVDWATAEHIGQLIGVPRDRTCQVLGALNALRATGHVYRDVPYDELGPNREASVAYWCVA